MKNSTIFTLIGYTLLIISLIGMFIGSDNLKVLVGILMSNVWIIGGASVLTDGLAGILGEQR